MDSIYIDKSSEVREIYKAAEKSTTDRAKERLSSLDFFRGLVMVALMIGETGFFLKLYQAAPDSFTQLLSIQFEHSDWHGLTFWDTVLPAFMTMAGVAMALSYKKQQQLGYSKKHSFLKVLRRSLWLLFWGILIYSVRDQHLNWQLSNVLTQLAFTTLIAFSIINQPIWVQLATSVLCLLIPEILFRVIQIPGYDQPFVEFHNFGTFINKSLGIKIDLDHKTNFINFISSGAHTIWGVMAGQLLLSNTSPKKKVMNLLSFGASAIIIGLTLDTTGITPMLKWISTSSFVFVTGGITLVVLALCYEWIDVRNHKNNLKFFIVVGMNSIFIYLFFIFIGDKWLNGYMEILVGQLLNIAGVSLALGSAISCIVVFILEWYLCYFLYKKKIFFRL